jgi:hypothetical protein
LTARDKGWEVIVFKPISEGFGRLGVSVTVTIDINHAEGQGTALSTICPEVEGVLPSKVGVEVAIGRCAHVARGVVPPDQQVVGVSIHATWFGPTEAIGADQLSQVGANWVFDSFCLQLLSYHYYIIVAEVLFFLSNCWRYHCNEGWERSQPLLFSLGEGRDLRGTAVHWSLLQQKTPG